MGAERGMLGSSQLGSGNTAMQGGNAATGSIINAVGGLFGEGGIVTEPTNAVVGEAGPEAILPLTDKPRMEDILGKLKGTPAAEPIKEAVSEKPTEKPVEKKADSSNLDIIIQLAAEIDRLRKGKENANS
jgi:hypothetical protein